MRRRCAVNALRNLNKNGFSVAVQFDEADIPEEVFKEYINLRNKRVRALQVRYNIG